MEDRYYTSMLVRDGIIVSISDDEMALTDEVVDLNNAYVYPGFHDSHMHLENFGKTLFELDLKGITSILELKNRTIDYIKEGKCELSLLFARGWNQDYFVDKGFPTRKDLDEISMSIPIVMVRVCGHILVCNGKAIELAQIKEEPTGGSYDEELGIYRETACDLMIQRLEQKRDVVMEKQYILKGQKIANSYGITSISTNDIYAEKAFVIAKAYKELEEEGKLNTFIFHQVGSSIDEFLKIQSNFRKSFFNVSYSIKIFMDGSLGAKTAWISENYIGENHNGICCVNLDELVSLVKTANEKGIPVVGHAIGDLAISTLADIFSKVDPLNKVRNAIIHVQITDETLVDKLRDNNILAYTQPIFIHYDMHIVGNRVKNLYKSSYAFNAMIKKGIHQSFGTDCPVESLNPFENLYCAVTRLDLFGNGPYLASEKMDLKTAFDCYTTQGAYSVFYEDRIGRLNPGFYANFFTLDEDLFETDFFQLKNIKPRQTYVMGKKIIE